MSGPCFSPQKTLESILSSFLWKNTHPLIVKSSLQVSKSSGGLACQNLHNYFISSQLAYVYDWLHADPQTPSVALLSTFFVFATSLKDELHKAQRSRCSCYSPIDVGFLAWKEGGNILMKSNQGPSPHCIMHKKLYYCTGGMLNLQ